ncbi:hypothetical protein BGZ83_006291 [Gryganskiella cystojenkinii]|nr:hypothetical protein BGZ83_006291 [Gryganskiella cystojenkinii]
MRFSTLSIVCAIFIPALAVAAEPKTVDIIMTEIPGVYDDDFFPVRLGPRFEPPSVVINVGDTVRWTNRGVFPHTVDEGKDCVDIADRILAGNQSFTSRSTFPLTAGGVTPAVGVFEHKFEQAGEFTYFCLPHCAGSILPKDFPKGLLQGLLEGLPKGPVKDLLKSLIKGLPEGLPIGPMRGTVIVQ